jgi:hypothetical protein
VYDGDVNIDDSLYGWLREHVIPVLSIIGAFDCAICMCTEGLFRVLECYIDIESYKYVVTDSYKGPQEIRDRFIDLDCLYDITFMYLSDVELFQDNLFDFILGEFFVAPCQDDLYFS